ncbi:MAG: SDR family oxidoreductase [Bacteroidetes bacterium]|nr:SDR family oxidoreductase [Bacteroidota bacterium]
MKRILICGSNGLLGQRLAKLFLSDTNFEVLNTSYHRTFFLNSALYDYTQLDITSRSDLKSLSSSFHPDVIINASGVTNVDLCEKEREHAWRVNVNGVQNLVDVSRALNAKLIHISTDYVFDGNDGPYSETSRPNPINYYGRTKLAGENAILSSDINYSILRTIVLYGTGNNIKYNFALWVVKNLIQSIKIKCVQDQISNPTFVTDLANACLLSIDNNQNGVFHIAGPNLLSRYEFACSLADAFDLDKNLIECIWTKDLQQVANRPKKSGFVLEKAKKILNYSPTPLLDSLKEMKKEFLLTN